MFDLLSLDGFDLRKSPQIERKRILKSLYDEAGMASPVLYSEHLTEYDQAMFEAAARLNCEGIVSERVDTPYRSDRNEGWLKIKTSVRDKFPIVGFIKDPSGIAALYLGKRDGKELLRGGVPLARHRAAARSRATSRWTGSNIRTAGAAPSPTPRAAAWPTPA